MVTKVMRAKALREATEVLKRYQTTRLDLRRWSCEVCGMIHSGTEPVACDSCGAIGAFVTPLDTRREIGSRW